ncbi:hypothetical protein HF086_011811 [Spodoptera exigua]|uniref:DUF5641 domain-containing protein n=1 Tax=Spodoptera exigua TaxID=7107 RepID=A0A922SN58_SPOEX|nr:hypothetical protein HF086_011811 [Spodoptera exigua]
MNKQLWKRWSSEYLQQLQARSKWRKPNRNFKIGDVVLIKEENLPPGKWALGRIQDVHPGKDNYVRVVSLKTKGDNIIKRPVNKLVLLPTNEDTAQDQAIDQGNSSNPSPPSSCQQKRVSVLIVLVEEYHSRAYSFIHYYSFSCCYPLFTHKVPTIINHII